MWEQFIELYLVDAIQAMITSSSSTSSALTLNDIAVITWWSSALDRVKRVLTRAHLPFGSVEDQLTSSSPMLVVDLESNVQSGEWAAVFVMGGGVGDYDYVPLSRARTSLTFIDQHRSQTSAVQFSSSYIPHVYNSST